jgi:hypothetical protein
MVQTHLSWVGQLDFAEPALLFGRFVEEARLGGEGFVDLFDVARDGCVLWGRNSMVSQGSLLLSW